MTKTRFVSMVLAGALVVSASMAMKARAESAPGAAWLARVNASHKQFFDAPKPEGGLPLVHVMNYYDTYNTAFGVKDADVDAVLTFYGGTTFFGLDDAMWSKYALGEFAAVTDPATNAPATRNIWRQSPVILGMTLPGAGIDALYARGATFLVCDNAMHIFAGLVAAKRGLEAAKVYDDMRAHILPTVTLVPGMVIAVEQAQRAGLSYHRQ